MPANAVDRLAARLSELAGAPVELERPSDPEHGDYATNIALRTAPQRKQPPRELAAELAERAEALEEIERAEVAGPGFLNLWVTTAWLADALREIGPDYGAGSALKREKIQVELISANPAGPLTVGSARNGAYGDSVARLLDYAGHEVAREYYFNDAGRQVDLFRASVEARRSGEELPEGGYQGEYINELAALGVDPVEHMLGEIRREVADFRIHIDTWRHQGEIEKHVAEVLPRLDTYEAEGTIWARTSAYGDDKDRPLYDPERIEVLIYQLVHIVEGGLTKKISKRRGDVVFLHELVEKIGIDAARWYLISRGHDQPIDIDVDLAAERSQKNPVYYVQYAHARIAGILRNAEATSPDVTAPTGLEREERDLIKRLAEFPVIAAESAERRSPHAIPIYAIRVADDFHRFYHEHRVVGSETEAFRLALVRGAQHVIARALDLIGVEAPERM